uniref:SPOR domain-containing protein n=1 Tax=Candidatus Kentrum sp. TUN TaxID=2126343 RepID=A0A451AJF7_9GAMM|nr:MAG: hypothetical protein BECKTUN1418F_GA0071002_11216 [Candidatus Kentron sp. TUN]VFK66154.1 MAG: hypothetical protein BECKTUN1418E_GA0071001_11196 [Candidatus Kentron sp. TUN]
MKWVFYLLLAVNVAYFAWQKWYIDSPVISSPEVPNISLPNQANRLLLLNEIDPTGLQLRTAPHAQHQKPPLAATPKPITKPASIMEKPIPVIEKPTPVTELAAKMQVNEDKKETQACLRLGPLSKKIEINAVRAWLKTHNITTVSQTHERRKIPLHWVYFPPFKTHAEAKKYADRMRKNGIKDIYVLPEGKMSRAISLGIFSKRASMENRIAELREKGYSPSIGSRARVQKITWLNITLPTKLTFPETYFTKKFPSLETVQANCVN